MMSNSCSFHIVAYFLHCVKFHWRTHMSHAKKVIEVELKQVEKKIKTQKNSLKQGGGELIELLRKRGELKSSLNQFKK